MVRSLPDPKPKRVVMINDLVNHTWRIAMILGPLVAIALTLAAGRRWS